MEIAHLRKAYGPLVAVDDVSLTVAGGEILGILGPNGAGQTSTVECATALRTPDAGTVRLLGLAAKRGSYYGSLSGGQKQRLSVALASLAIILITSVTEFGAPAPKSPAGLTVSLAVSIAGLFPIGLAITAIARTANAASVIGRLAFFP